MSHNAFSSRSSRESMADIRSILFSLLLGHFVLQFPQASHHVPTHLLHHVKPRPFNASQPYRTGYHFQPKKNWINDPNAPMVYKGVYHLFYQYNPTGAVWGNIVWAHSTSMDLVNWTPHSPALTPSQESDINGCWSGSATILPGNKPAILYTGINSKNQQVQNLALPKNTSDPYLIEWVKPHSKPLMAGNKINSSSFRDPTTAWMAGDGSWRTTVGSEVGDNGVALLYKSRSLNDFDHWTQAQEPLYTAKGTGMWECPDFFPVSAGRQKGFDTSVTGEGVSHVLKVSLDDVKHDYYMVGEYDSIKERFLPHKEYVPAEKWPRYDYGKFYASKTFFDSVKPRRILWGWVNESSSQAEDIMKGWSGIMAIPRAIWLDKNGKLVQQPVKEIEMLRKNMVGLSRTPLKGRSTLPINNITASQADVEVSFSLKGSAKAQRWNSSWTNPQLLCDQNGGRGAFGLLVLASKDREEFTAVYFTVFRHQNKRVVLMCSDQNRSSLDKDTDKTIYGAFVDLDPTQKTLTLRSMIDHSVVESFGGGGRACITARVYPTMAVDDKAFLYAFNNGPGDVEISSLKAWSMKKAHIS